MELYLLQKELTYNVKDDSGNEYTVTILEDWNSLHIEYDIFDSEGEEVENENIVFNIIQFIETQRT
jgi:hypothetical protein